MVELNQRNQLIVGAGLLLLMIATRGIHVPGLMNLPSASWAVFLLAGVYLRPVIMLPLLLIVAGGVDWYAMNKMGVSSYCFSPAYWMLIPAYSSLWAAGRWYSQQHRFHISTLLPLTVAVVAGTMVCELWSSGGFYWFSGRFDDKTIAEMLQRLQTYYPANLASVAFYTVAAAAMHAGLKLALGKQVDEQEATQH